MLQHEHLHTMFGFGTAEIEPSKLCYMGQCKKYTLQIQWLKPRRVHFADFSSLFSKPRCVDAVCQSLRQSIVSRPGEDLKRRFSWFPDWIPKVQKRVNLADLEMLKITIYLQHLASIQSRTLLPKFGLTHSDPRTPRPPC